MGYRDAQRREARRELVRCENGFEVPRQASGDLRRQAGGSEHAPPMLDDEISLSLKVGIFAGVASRISLAVASARMRSRAELAVASVVKPDCT